MILRTKSVAGDNEKCCFPATSVLCGIYRASASGWPCHRWGRKVVISHGSSPQAEPVYCQADVTGI